MRSLHLFAGAGGGLLADLILGHTPIGAVEIDPYCCDVLRARRADGWFPGLRVHEQDIRLFDPSGYAGRVDLVAGGFPCQDISAAGRGAGITGERSGLWSEFARVLRMVRPRYAFIENSPMLTLRGLGVVLSDLAALGFDAEWQIVSAAQAGAPHIRERIWILAHADGLRLEEYELFQSNLSARSGEDVAHAKRDGRDGVHERQQSGHLETDARIGSPDGASRRPAEDHRQSVPWEGEEPGAVVAHANQERWGGRTWEQWQTWRIELEDSRDSMANPNRLRQLQPQGRECDQRGWAGDGGIPMRNANGAGLEIRQGQPGDDGTELASAIGADRRLPQSGLGVLADELSPHLVSGWWDTEPDVGRLATGVKNRVGQLKALCNAQVPLQCALAWRILSDAIPR